jgi:hypothetical protein
MRFLEEYERLKIPEWYSHYYDLPSLLKDLESIDSSNGALKDVYVLLKSKELCKVTDANPDLSLKSEDNTL